MPKINCLGAGSWGIAISSYLSKKEPNIWLWEGVEVNFKKLKESRQDPARLPGITLPPSVRIVNDLAEALFGCEVLLFVLPSHTIEEVAKKVAPFIKTKMLVVSLSKGLTPTMERISEVLKRTLPQAARDRIVVLSGPSHAEEVAAGLPTAIVASSENPMAAEAVQTLLSSSTLRVYTNSDPVGVELAGALKNVVAIACGVADGLGFGDNTKGALLTRGLAEITRLGVKMGAQPQTFAGLAGMGDLITTGISRHSRNRFVGERIGKGEKLPEILAKMVMVAEGVNTTKAAVTLAKKHGVEMPIAQKVYEMLFEDKPAILALKELMERELKTEAWH
ncbi:MAG: NAD(P)-dependent glycerol-3-phosphate dehydrogenase [candidate division Zixibacteria bacterium]|nr:NAD(P)-dependent glycerol-3-phosphate dehydrogenase [candidate division Zixibacteria bacterium]